MSLRKLLLRIVDEAGVEDVSMLRKGRFRLLEVRLRLRQEPFSRVELSAVHGTDCVRRQANHFSRKRQSLFARLMLGVQMGPHLVRDCVEAVGVHRSLTGSGKSPSRAASIIWRASCGMSIPNSSNLRSAQRPIWRGSL